MKKLILISLSLFGLHFEICAQLFISESNADLVCPGVALEYSFTSSLDLTGCQFEWTVTNGQIVGGTPNGNNSTIIAGTSIFVVWNNVATTGTIEVESFGCAINASNVIGPGKPFRIRSLTGGVPGPISGPILPVPIGVTGELNFTVPEETNFPLRGFNNNPVRVDGFEWEIPTGWTINFGGDTRSVFVQPNACNGGNIRVRAVNLCDANNPLFSEWSAPFPVTRSIPQPGPITGPAVAVCKRTAPVTYSVPPVSGATSYTLSAS